MPGCPDPALGGPTSLTVSERGAGPNRPAVLPRSGQERAGERRQL